MSPLKSLRVKAILWALVPTLTVLAVVAVTSIYVYGQVTQDVVRQRDAELAQVSALRLAERLDQYADMLQTVAVRNDIQSLEPSRLAAGLAQTSDEFQIFDAGLTVYDSQGAAIWSHPGGAPRRQTNFPVPSLINELEQTRRPTFSSVSSHPDTDGDVVFLAVPILGSGGEFTGVLAGASSLRTSLSGTTFDQVLKLKTGRSGFVYLIDGNGRIISHPDMAQLGRDYSGVAPVKQVSSGTNGALITQDLNGTRVISGYAPVLGTSWGLVTQEEWANVVGPIEDWGKLLLGLLAAGGAMAAVLIFWATGRILTPIKELTRGAELIAAGNFNHTIVANTGDEIEALAQRFNSMALDLRESYTNLEQRVESRTEELRKSQQAERELAEENNLLTRIGQVMSSTLDINEVYEQFSAEVRNLMGFDRINVSVVNVDEGTYTVKYLSGIAQPGRRAGDEVPLAGTQTQKIAQAAQTIIVQDLHAGTEFPADPALQGVGLRSRIMVPLISRSSVIGTMTLHSRQAGAYGQREQVILERLAHQIAPAVENARLYEEALKEQERATAALAELQSFDSALRASEERYRTLFEQSKDAIFVTRDGVVVESNKAALDLFGYTREQAIGLEVGEVYANIDDRGNFRRELQKHGSVKDFELRLVRKDGSEIDCLLTASRRHLDNGGSDDGESSETQGTIRDVTERKRAEEALRQSEERYRALFEQSTDAIIIGSPHGYLIDVNQSALDLFGYTREEISNLDHRAAWVDTEDHDRFVEETHQKDTVKDYEARLIKKNGEEMECLITSTMLKDQKGEVLAHQAVIRDVTERKRAEEALRQSEDRLRRAQQAGRLGTWDWNVGTNELIWDGVEPIHGVPVGSFERSFEAYLRDVHPDDRELVMGKITQAAARAADLSMEYRIIWPDGSLHWVQGTGRAFPDSSGRTVRMTGTCQDITNRKEAEEALRQSEERYRRLVEQAVDSFCIIDRLGMIRDVNQEACDSLGYSRDELLRLAVTDICADTALPLSDEAWEEWVRNPAPVTVERTLRRKDGTTVPVELRVGLIELNNNHLMFALARDVTERKESEETQIQQARELAILGERNRMAREIHDTLAQGFTGVILQLEAAEQAQDENPPEVLDHLDRAKGLARDSLQEARRSVWNLLPHALEQLSLEDALQEEVKKFTEESQIQASFQFSGNRQLPSEAQTALLRICQESLNNVRRHADATEVAVDLTFNSNDVCLNIQDNGQGFDVDNLNGLTEQGGFGLTAMKQRARLLGGTLNVSSGKKQGTQIEARIPTT